MTETKFARDRLLILDEAISPLENIKIQFTDPEWLKEISVIDASDAPGFYELVADETTLRVLLDRVDTESRNYKTFGKKAQELAEFTFNSHYRAVIDADSFDKASSGVAFEDNEKVILTFTIFMLPTIVYAYKDVVMITANFDDTLCSLMWSKTVEFEPHTEIEAKLDYSSLHHKKDVVRLYHVPIKNLSGTFLKRLDKESCREELGTQIFADMFASTIAEVFGETRHIFCLNKHPRENQTYRWTLESEKAGQRLYTNASGRNDLDDYGMAVFGAAINFDPITANRLFVFYQITSEKAKTAIGHLTAYQFCGRTSLRKQKCQDAVVLVLPDKGTAEFMQKLLDCEPSTPLPMSFEQPKRGRPVNANKAPPKPRKSKKTAEEKREEARLRKQKSRAKSRQIEIHV